MGILKEENLHLQSPTEARFFKSITTLLSVQTRSAVSQSVGALVEFFQRYAKEHPKTPREVMALQDTDERESAFLIIKLTQKGEEIQLKDAPDKVMKKILQLFCDFVVC